MAVEKLVKRIRDDAKGKAANTAGSARERAAQERDRVSSEKEKRLAEMRKESEREFRTLKNRILSQAKLEARKMELEVREEMIEQVFKEALESLGAMSTGEHQEYLRMSIGKSVNLLGQDLTVLCTEDDLASVKELARKISPSVEVEASLDSVGGIKARSKDGAFIDLTFEANLERKRKELRREISEMMFREDI